MCLYIFVYLCELASHFLRLPSPPPNPLSPKHGQPAIDDLSVMTYISIFKDATRKAPSANDPGAADKPFACKYCPETFADAVQHRNHEDSHVPYACNHCPDRFADKQEHKKHEEGHFPFPCQDANCSDRFKDEAALKKHAVVHEKKPAPAAAATPADGWGWRDAGAGLPPPWERSPDWRKYEGDDLGGRCKIKVNPCAFAVLAIATRHRWKTTTPESGGCHRT